MALEENFPNGISPTDAQDFLKTLRKDAQSLRESGQAVSFEMKDFHTNLYEGLRNATDKAIDSSLAKSGYSNSRGQYAQIVSGRKEAISAANAWIRQTAGKGGGVAHPIVNLFSIESIVSGLATGKPTQGIIKALYLQASKKILDWTISKDAQIKSMYTNAAKIERVKPVHVFNPEILNDVSVSERLSLPPPKSKKLKRIADETSKPVIITEDPVKRVTFNPNFEGVRFGKEITGGEQGFTGGFGNWVSNPNK